MKNVFFLFVALIISQNAAAQCTQVATATQNMTWTGTADTSWANHCNWSPSGVPTATNRITIPNVAKKPVVLTGTMATCLSIAISTSSSLTINNGGTLTVLPTDERGTFNGTINGIFTDSLATISAGTFVAPQAFTPLATLPRGIQTLYVKITPSGGACSYIVPFSYNTLTSSVSKVDVEALALQQNRPNPFSQATTIAFTLSETNKAVLTVYDITGRQVFTLNRGFNIGNNEVVLNKSVFQNTGTYFYRLTTEKYVAVKRLQFVAD
jgi:hypothetical protein